MNTKQLTYPTIQEQQKFWINKEAQSNNATNETREVLIEQRVQLLSACQSLADFSYTDYAAKWSEQSALQELVAIKRKARRAIAACLVAQLSTTAEPEPKDIGGNELPDRIEANEDWHELNAERNV